jgi:CheY-like chemotaxis protein
MKEESKNKKQLIAEIEELKSRISELSLFSESISYEIRTPLNSIIGFSGMLYKNESGEEKKEMLYQIITNGRALLAIIDRLGHTADNKDLTSGDTADGDSADCGSGGFLQQAGITAVPLNDIETSGLNATGTAGGPENPFDKVDSELSGEKLTLLLAEDNPSNAKLITRLLKQFGHEIIVVENGLQAVEAVSRFKFDAVLMDIQMPVMNGKDAAAAIRRAGYGIAILALTACAVKEERDECLKAGMDAFILKPINIDDIEPLIRRVVKYKKKSAPAEYAGRDIITKGNIMTENVQQKPQLKNFNREKLDEIMGGIEEIMREAVELFLEGVTDNIGDIQNAINSKDAQLTKKLTHKLKGSALNACADKTSDILAKMEYAAEENDFEKLGDLFETLNDAINDFEREVKNARLY